MKYLDGLIKQEVEVARDCALKGKADAEAAAEELTHIFTTDKTMLELAKVTAEAGLARIVEVYNRNLKLVRQW